MMGDDMKDNLAARLQSGEVVQETGVVVGNDGEGFSVRGGSGTYRARRAVSCLVEPECEDVVLVATFQSGACYVLAVLERAGAGATRIVAEGDLEMNVPRGGFSVTAREGIELVSPKDVSVVAAATKVNSVTADVAVQRLTIVGRYLQSEFERIKTFARSLDAVVGRFSQRAKSSYRRVDGLDQLRAEQVDHRADKTLNLHGANTLMTAEQLVKVDGEQIHVG